MNDEMIDLTARVLIIQKIVLSNVAHNIRSTGVEIGQVADEWRRNFLENIPGPPDEKAPSPQQQMEIYLKHYAETLSEDVLHRCKTL